MKITNFGSAKHHAIEENPQLLESDLTGPDHGILLNGSQDFIVPETSLGTSQKKSGTRAKAQTCCIGL